MTCQHCGDSRTPKLTGRRGTRCENVAACNRRAIVRKQALRDMESAHAEGLHDDLAREFCPAC